MSRKQRSDKGQKRETHEHSFKVTTPRHVDPEVAQAHPTYDGPTTGYRDAADGKVERKSFNNGVIPQGWHDNPAACDNCDGMSHPEFVEG
jgi:hypothetical protein